MNESKDHENISLEIIPYLMMMGEMKSWKIWTHGTLWLLQVQIKCKLRYITGSVVLEKIVLAESCDFHIFISIKCFYVIPKSHINNTHLYKD